MEALVEVGRWIFAQSDPLLVFAILILGYWIYKSNKRHEENIHEVAKKIDSHLDPKVKYPHPRCEMGESNYNALIAKLDKNDERNREDHGKLFDKIDDLKVSTIKNGQQR